ncbi:DUF4129 domain-containing protein [Mycobacterium sp. SM1]|uniref:DUF4129 domain-containing protein n=1 Tax=Mycobacterium sp. SM1 TaxID=2816243 RepID=UPI001BCCE76D|nr:DUF4129 domain-containing protein [Mycobacterium sp. SM1]MBS4727398.1 DUF4129 domain-containing protein [Mycobacterium sp. SM1]
MPGMDKPTWRVIALIVLLILVAAALRGYLPAPERAAHRAPPWHPAALVIVAVLLGVSLVLMAMSVVAGLHTPRAKPARSGARVESVGALRGRPSWRVLLIGLGVILAWLVIVMLMTRLAAQYRVAQLVPAPPTGAPTPESPAAPAAAPGYQSTGADAIGYLAASTAVLLLLAASAVVVLRRRQRILPSAITAACGAGAAGPETLARAAEQGLVEIGNLSREPRDAIIACYTAMERALARVPGAGPRDFDTPTEVLARAVAHRALQAQHAAALVGVFEEARFSPHVMDEGHRAIAVHALRQVLAELRSAAA